jgi:alpha-glucosidase
VPDEATSFTVPSGSTVWSHDLNGHYEAVHDKKAIARNPGRPVARASGDVPVARRRLRFHHRGGARELQRDGAPGWAANASSIWSSVTSIRRRIRFGFDTAMTSSAYRSRRRFQGTITSPWRVVMIGSDLNALVNCDIVHNLCPPPDPKLFPKGMNTDWIKPGRAVWKYLDGGPNSFEGMKEFSRLAGELGFEYHVIEGFWSRWSDEQIKELVDYSKQRGVGLFFWRHSNQLRTPEARETFFKRLHDLGVVGAKIDFFDHEHKEIVDLYTDLLKEAAKNKIMVNFHGANKPTGEPRTWPNELLREGVRGMESSRLQARAKHDTTLPFTRYLAGHGDYTPVHFGARRGDTTWAHQIATAAIFDEPLLTYGAHPTNLLSNPALPMIKSIPSVWDDTIVLPPSEIGELAVLARRSGKEWFVAIINGTTARSMTVPLSFLGRGNYRALIVRDQKDDPAAVKIENTTSRRSDSIKIDLSAGGGFIARFSPN